MTAAARHRLDGLEADNLLAFMALLGLLRALDAARPEWRARAYWDDARLPLRPILALGQPQTQDAVAQAAAEGANGLAEVHAFDRKDLNFTGAEAKEIHLKAADAGRQLLFDALMSDGAVRNDGRIWPTPLCFLFGQGHQHFLERLADVPTGKLPKALAKTRRPPDLNAARYLASTLFSPWTHEDATDSFRWDPVDDRRYALRADDPSTDAAGTQHGANRLAAIGLPILSGAAIMRRRETRFLNRATAYGEDGGIQITWPLWTAPARLAGLRALLAHPELAAEAPAMGLLRMAGVFALYRAKRISVGKYFNITAATRIA